MLYRVEWPGRLAITPRPADYAPLREAGVDTLVCALSENELRGDEAERAVAVGLSYVPFPIADFGVPDLESLSELAQELAGQVRAGRFVVAHCWGGVGRSGVIAGATLIRLGATAEQAVALLTAARGIPSPETAEQRALLERLTT